MNTMIYDSRRVFWPANAPAKSIPIEIESPGKISSAKNVQEAIQMLTDDISCTIGNLPEDLNRDENTLKETIDCINQILDALRHLRTDTTNTSYSGE